jgi:membrane protein DedA with SNARE-associated domain
MFDIARLIQDVLAFVEGAYEQYGYLIVFGASLAENTALLSILLPGGTMVMLGGVYAGTGYLSLPLVILVGATGTVIGSSFDFLLGRLSRRGALGFLGRSRRVQQLLGKAEHFYDEHGPRAILGAHFIGWARAIASLGAGASGMPYRRFLRYEIIAAFLWNALFSGLGFIVGAGGMAASTAPMITVAIGVTLAILIPVIIRPRVKIDPPIDLDSSREPAPPPHSTPGTGPMSFGERITLRPAMTHVERDVRDRS